MDRNTYEQLADACLARVERWLEAFDPDELDYSKADGVVKLEFPDNVTFVLNRQAGANQMWFAAGARAWHYGWDGENWIDDRDGHELFGNLARVVGAKLGRAVEL